MHESLPAAVVAKEEKTNTEICFQKRNAFKWNKIRGMSLVEPQFSPMLAPSDFPEVSGV